MESEAYIAELKEMIAASGYIVFFGGAGVSTESGIPDYRSADGLYNQQYDYPPEEMLSIGFFRRYTEEFYRFYRDRMIYTSAQPNAAHRSLAELERRGKLRAVVTQNIDGLHQLAGSRAVLELHGSIHRNYCTACQAEYGLPAITGSSGVPTCSCGGVIRPGVVLYGEGLDNDLMQQAIRHISAADMLIAGGSSLSVYPAAGLLEYFGGERLVLINKDITPMDKRAQLVIHEAIGEVLAAVV